MVTISNLIGRHYNVLVTVGALHETNHDAHIYSSVNDLITTQLKLYPNYDTTFQ